MIAFLLVWLFVFRRAGRNTGPSSSLGTSRLRRGPVIVPWVFPGGGGGFGGGSGGGDGFGGGFGGGGGSSGGGGASGSW